MIADDDRSSPTTLITAKPVFSGCSRRHKRRPHRCILSRPVTHARGRQHTAQYMLNQAPSTAVVLVSRQGLWYPCTSICWRRPRDTAVPCGFRCSARSWLKGCKITVIPLQLSQSRCENSCMPPEEGEGLAGVHM